MPTTGEWKRDHDFINFVPRGRLVEGNLPEPRSILKKASTKAQDMEKKLTNFCKCPTSPAGLGRRVTVMLLTAGQVGSSDSSKKKKEKPKKGRQRQKVRRKTFLLQRITRWSRAGCDCALVRA
jgi:hypothetical protein